MSRKHQTKPRPHHTSHDGTRTMPVPVEVGQHQARDQQRLHQHVPAVLLDVLRRVEVQVLIVRMAG